MLGLDFTFITAATWGMLWHGMVVTFKITATALIVGMVWGTLLALMRLSSWRPVSLFARGYVNLFRSIPLPMVLLGFYLIVPQMLQALFWQAATWDTRMMSALVGFSLFEAAYYAEIMRAGIQSVPRGQLSAANALGMQPMQAMRLVVLPQAFRNMLPLLLTQLIVLFQDTSLVYVISLADFFTSAENIGERDGRIEEMMILAGVSYFIICYAASLGVRYLSRKRVA